MRNLEVIGEAASQLSEDFKSNHPEVPWREIKNFRNVVAHRYWQLNMERVWDIIEHKLDPLKNKIEKILEE